MPYNGCKDTNYFWIVQVFHKVFYTTSNQLINKKKGSRRDLRAVVVEGGGEGGIGFEENLFFFHIKKKVYLCSSENFKDIIL